MKNKIKINGSRMVVNNGVSYEFRDDGTILANGNTNNNDSNIYIYGTNSKFDCMIPFKAGDYTFTGCPKFGDNNVFVCIAVCQYEGNIDIYNDIGYGVNVHVPENSRISIAIKIKEGLDEINQLEFKPMLRLSSDPDDAFEPYETPAGGGGGTVVPKDASDIKYDNSSSGFKSNNVQDAIDEISKSLGSGSGSGTSSGYNKEEIDALLQGKVSKEENKSLLSDSDKQKYDDAATKTKYIGDFSTITVNNVADLVSAINHLDANSISKADFTNKIITISFKDGSSLPINISSIIADTNIEDFKNVNLQNLSDGQILAYDLASKKFVNIDDPSEDILQNAKSYTDSQIQLLSSQQQKSEIVSSKPDQSTSEENVWYYYKENDVWKQTIYINGTEITFDTGSPKLSNMISKDDVESTFDGTQDSSKVASIACLIALESIINTKLGSKVNTSDIVDNLNSQSADKPLSANQGKILNDNASGIASDLSAHVSDTGIHMSTQDKNNFADVISAKHTHPNESVLNKFGEDSNGNVLFDGKAIQGIGTELDAYTDDEIESAVKQVLGI